MDRTDDLDSEYELHSQEAIDEFTELIESGRMTVKDQCGNVLLDRGNHEQSGIVQFQSEEMTQAFLRVLHTLGIGPDIWAAGENKRDSGDGDICISLAV